MPEEEINNLENPQTPEDNNLDPATDTTGDSQESAGSETMTDAEAAEAEAQEICNGLKETFKDGRLLTQENYADLIDGLARVSELKAQGAGTPSQSDPMQGNVSQGATSQYQDPATFDVLLDAYSDTYTPPNAYSDRLNIISVTNSSHCREINLTEYGHYIIINRKSASADQNGAIDSSYQGFLTVSSGNYQDCYPANSLDTSNGGYQIISTDFYGPSYTTGPQTLLHILHTPYGLFILNAKSN